MSADYYQQKLNEIKQSIEHNQLKDAEAALHEELSMPYIPARFETEFHALQQELTQRLRDQTPPKSAQLSDETILRYMQGTLDQQLHSLDVLARENLRLRTALIQHIFDLPIDPLILKLLIQVCIEQALSDVFETELEGVHYQFIPASLTSPTHSVVMAALERKLQTIFEKNPSFFEMAKHRLSFYAVNLLPLSYDEAEAESLCHQIVYDVYHALHEDDAWNEYHHHHHVDLNRISTL